MVIAGNACNAGIQSVYLLYILMLPLNNHNEYSNQAPVDASTLTPALSREQEAKLALENTVVARLVARLLITCFY
jgi:hypothetical protein